MSYDRIEGRFVYGDDVYIDDYYMDEVWEYINGFPHYMVSNKGRVWSERTQRFLKVKPLDDHGHLGVCLHEGGRAYYRYIHRLVAEAFIPNPNGYPVVRHIIDDPSLNSEFDIEWGTQYDNIHDTIRNGKFRYFTEEDRYKANRDKMMRIVAIDIKTGDRIVFESQSAASRALKIPQANIWKVLKGERATAGGYHFRKAENE